MLLGQLLQPFGYLFIRHPYKWVVDWLYPMILALLGVLVCSAVGDLASLVKSGGFLAMVLSFVQSLPGFYIAALAAIATFGRSDIDQLLPEPTPKVVVKYRGSENTVPLTRRRFLAMLFAFLTAVSLLLIMMSIFYLSYGEQLFKWSVESYKVGLYLGTFCIWVYFLFLSQMIIATFWGLYYLGYKLHE